MNIYDIADLLDRDIVVTRYANQKGRWCIHFENCEVKEKKDSYCLVGAHGNGTTVQAAMADYINQIKGKLLVFDAFSDKRREFQLPDTLTQ